MSRCLNLYFCLIFGVNCFEMFTGQFFNILSENMSFQVLNCCFNDTQEGYILPSFVFSECICLYFAYWVLLKKKGKEKYSFSRWLTSFSVVPHCFAHFVFNIQLCKCQSHYIWFHFIHRGFFKYIVHKKVTQSDLNINEHL